MAQSPLPINAFVYLIKILSKNKKNVKPALKKMGFFRASAIFSVFTPKVGHFDPLFDGWGS